MGDGVNFDDSGWKRKPMTYEKYFFLFLWGLWRHQMTSSIYRHPLLSYDVIDDVIEVRTSKQNMFWNCLAKTQILVYLMRESVQKQKVMTTCFIYDVIVISAKYANFKNSCKSQFLTDFDDSGWKWKLVA